MKTVFLPRQARDEHGESTQKERGMRFLAGAPPAKMSAADLKAALQTAAPQGPPLASWQVEHLLHLIDSDGEQRRSVRAISV